VAKPAPAESEAPETQPSTALPAPPAPPEVPGGGEEDLPVGNPLPGNGDDTSVERVQEAVTRVAAQVTEGIPDL
jgi:hypothetical protein